MRKFLFIILITSVLFSCKDKTEVDKIFYFGKVHCFDQGFTIHESMAIKDGKIIALGTDDEILSNYKGKEININGRFIVPRLNLPLDSIRLLVANFNPEYKLYLPGTSPIMEGIQDEFDNYTPLKTNTEANFNIISPGKRLFLPIESYSKGERIFNIHLSKKFLKTF